MAQSRQQAYAAARKHKKQVETEFILPNRLKELRSSKYMSQTDLANKLGVCKSTVSMWEHGTKGIKDRNKIELCRILKCDITTLFDWGI